MKLLLLFLLIAAQQNPPKKAPPRPPAVETFLKWLAKATGLAATSSGLKGEITDLSGDIWCAHIDKSGGGQHLTFEGSYQWPIFSKDDRTIIAIRTDDNQLWSIPVTGGDPTKFPHSPVGVTELVGSGPDGIVVFTGETIGLFEPESGNFKPFTPKTQSERNEIARLRHPARTYGPNLSVFVDQDKVVMKTHGETHEIGTPGERLGEPSLSHSGQIVVYIRTKL